MWQVPGIIVPHDWINFDPINILDEFDFPRIFTCNDLAGNLYLAYNCDYSNSGFRFLVVPCSEDTIFNLVKGHVNLRDGLYNYRAWIFDLNQHWEAVRAWQVNIDELPYDALPRPGTMLYADLPRIVISNPIRTCSSLTELTYSLDEPTGQPMVKING